MRGLETDHVILGPMRCLKKRFRNGHTDSATDGRMDIATTRLSWPRGLNLLKLHLTQQIIMGPRFDIFLDCLPGIS